MGGESDVEGLAHELLSLAQRIGDALGVDSDVTSMGDDEGGEELEEGEGDRGDKDREQGRDVGREYRASSSGKQGVSEAQVRRIIAKVLEERRKKGN